jgi:hypothetical protein
MADMPNFTKLVPGFDFLQGLVDNAGSALPNMGQWVAPTLNPEELEKRIEELRTVQFWLEQNARMLAATIQALEVQRMTLSTLKTMNVQMADLGEAMKLKVHTSASSPAPSSPAPAPAATSSDTPAPEAAPKGKARTTGTDAATTAPAGLVDPMQWWGALTQQFTQLAASALKDAPNAGLGGEMVKQGWAAAEQALKPMTAPGAPATKHAAAKGTGKAPSKRPAKRPAKKAAAARKRAPQG